MERRTFLKSTGASMIGHAAALGGTIGAGSLLGAFNPSNASATTPQPPPSLGGGVKGRSPMKTLSDDLSPYTGAWGETQLWHLLRRCMFGVPESQFLAAQHTAPFGSVATVPMNAIVTQLLACQDTTKVPLPSMVSSSPWVNNFPSSSSPEPNLLAMECQEIVNWWFDQMMQENLSIRQKMTLMWTNHFVVGSSTINNISAYVYQYLITCMTNALGNFKTFATAISQDPAMLLYLNGNQNYWTSKKNDINENYAREVMELFTLGINFPGTTTPNYTQDDVEANAQALTGWQPTTSFPFIGQFNSALHYTGSETFLGQTGSFELADVINIIFQQPTSSPVYPPAPAGGTAPGTGFPQGYTAAYWACQTLYKEFVYYDPYNDPSPSVIDQMARLMITNNFDIAPVMQALLTSQHFYDANVIGAQIKSPAMYMGSLVREFGLTYSSFVPTDPPATGKTDGNGNMTYTDTNPEITYITNTIMNNSQGQQLLNPPNVAGWPGGENWLSAGSFQGRQNYSNAILNDKSSLTFSASTYAAQIAGAGTLAEGVLFSDLEELSLAFTLGPIESADLAPDPTKMDDVIGTQVPSFAPALAQLPEFQLY